MALVDVNPEFVPGAKIKIIGVWWAWNKAVKRMYEEGLTWVDFVAVNCDAQDLATNPASKKLNIWLNVTRWLGAGADPEIGRRAAEESIDEIKMMLQGTDMVFITSGMWWGTGTGAAPVVAQTAKEMWILTVAIVTKPFSFEWKKRSDNADIGLAKMKPSVDTLIVIPNDKIFNIADKKTTFKQAFTMIDRILYLGVSGITDLIINPGDINIDFADVKMVMKDSGNAVLGIWYGKWEKRAVDAARKAIENPLLETNLDGAKKVIFAVTGGEDLTPIEVNEAAEVIREILDNDVNLVWWMTIDPSFEDEVKVTIIATGFEKQSADPILKSPNRDMLGRPSYSSQNDGFGSWFVTRQIWSTNQNPQQKEDEKKPEDKYSIPAFLRNNK